MTGNICIFSRRLTFFYSGFIACTQESRGKIAAEQPLAKIAPWTGERGGFIAPQPILAAPPVSGGDGGFAPWILYVKDLVVQILPNKIDFIISSYKVSIEDEKEFLNKVEDDVRWFFRLFQIEKFTRIAYVPQTGVDETESFNTDSFFKSLISMPKMKEESMKEQLVQVNYPSTMELSSGKYQINRFCTVSLGMKMQNSVECKCLIFSDDINTNSSNTYIFSLGEALEFITKAIEVHFDMLEKIF